MDFDEQNNFGFPVTLSAPGQLNVTEKRIDSPLASSLKACTGARMHARGLANTNVELAVIVFSPYCTQMFAARPDAPLPSSSTVH